jgi:hypothetical protein
MAEPETGPTAEDLAQEQLKASLGAALAHARIQRQHGRTGKSVAKLAGQKKPKAAKKEKGSTRMTSSGLTVSEQKRVDELVPKAAQQHGDYAPVNFKLIETVHGKKTRQHEISVVRNRGGTAVERWFARGRLDDRCMAAIMVYQGAYLVHIGQPRVVANWSAVIVRQATGALEMHASTRMRAKQTLRLLDQEIFFRRGVNDFNVWQNVVIFDEPAGIAGGRLGFTSKQAEAAAQVVITGIAHEIAALLIDRAPPDMEALLLDIDAPRKSRRRA